MKPAASPDDPYGWDVYLREDIDPTGRSASGVELVRNAIYHRLTTDKLLLVDSPDDGYVDFGVNVQAWVNGPLTQDEASAKAPRLALAIQEDARIDPASIQVSIDVQGAGAEYQLIISVSCRTTTDLPVSLVLGVSGVTVALLSQGR